MKREKRNGRRLFHPTSGIIAAASVAVMLFGCDQQGSLSEETDSGAPQTAFFAGKVAALGLSSSEDYIGIQGVTVQPLARGGFPDTIDGMFRINLAGSSGTTVANIHDSKDVVVAKLTFDPHGFVGWHTHPGPAVVTIAQGELTIVNESDCTPRLYAAGKAFLDPGQGNIHIAVNDTEAEVVVYATFIDIPPGMGPTELLETPGDCSL
jgi:quercetin dioxygenase-like cupin family protein